MSAVETLREAAKVLRERAGMTHAVHTQQVGEVSEVTYMIEAGGTSVTEQSVMHPGVALALAGWLDVATAGYLSTRLDWSPEPAALAVADLILGSSE